VYFTADVVSGDAPLTVTFDASASYDPDGSALTDYQAYGDGGEDGPSFSSPPSAVPEFQFTIPQPGNYKVDIRASDGNSQGNSAPKIISVLDNGNAFPTALLTVHEPRVGDAPHTIVLDMSGSFDPESAVLHYEFDIFCTSIENVMPLGDFEQDNLNDPVYEFVAAEAGFYEVYGRVTDGDGHSNVAYAGRVDITDNGNLPPRVGMFASQYSGAAPLTVTFTTNDWMLYDEDGSIAYVEIDPEGTQSWVEFNPETGFTYDYTLPGLYYPRLRAVDNLGLIGYSYAYSSITVN
jgi:PKD repeat protein